jgi:hypothetical protein
LERSVYVWPVGSVVRKRSCGLTGIDDFVTSVAWNKYVSISQTYFLLRTVKSISVKLEFDCCLFCSYTLKEMLCRNAALILLAVYHAVHADVGHPSLMLIICLVLLLCCRVVRNIGEVGIVAI